MTFISYEFLIFLAVSLVLYYGSKKRGKTAALFAVSTVFLWLCGGIKTLVIYGISAIMVWAGALWIEKLQGDAKDVRKKVNPAKAVYGIVVVILLALLAGFQYRNFWGYTMEKLHWLTGTQSDWTPVSVTAPVAISFYTLTLIGYLTEVYWESIKAEKSLVRLALFGGFFPQMAMGPIARYDRLSVSLFGENKWDWNQFLSGLLRMTWGFFQKLVISERLAMAVNTIYGDYETYTGSFLVFAAVCFAFQLYTDFAGAIDIALGVSEMFGVTLEENFCQPFYSRTVAEFWRRWHITLGGWFKDFVMYPLQKTVPFQKMGKWGRKTFGKKQGKKVPAIVSLLIVWFLLGLWHGGKWTFIIGSGLYHAVLMIMALLAEPAVKQFYKKTGIRENHPLWAGMQRVRTFILAAVGFVLFRSESLSMAWGIFTNMASPNLGLFSEEGISSLGLLWADWAVLAVSMALLWLVSYQKEHGRKKTWSSEQKTAAIFGLVFATLIFGWYGKGYDASAFIYSQF